MQIGKPQSEPLCASVPPLLGQNTGEREEKENISRHDQLPKSFKVIPSSSTPVLSPYFTQGTTQDQNRGSARQLTVQRQMLGIMA